MLLPIYNEFKKMPKSFIVAEDGVYYNKLDMTLSEFSRVCKSYCEVTHKNCQECALLSQAAQMVIIEGICSLSALFKECFPHVKYQATHAKNQVLKIPLACIRVGNPSDGTSQLLVTAFVNGFDYLKLREILNMKFTSAPSLFTKQDMNSLLLLGQSSRERECLRYAVYKATGMTQSQARKKFGFEKMEQRAKEVERCIKEAEHIKRSCQELAEIQAAALTSDSSDEEEIELQSPNTSSASFDNSKFDCLVNLLRDSNYNWFEFCEQVQCEFSEENDINAYFDELCLKLSSVFSENEMDMVRLSQEAYKADEFLYTYSRDRDTRVLNGEIVTDSEPDDPVDDIQLHSKEFQAAVDKKVAAIKRQTRRRRAKMIADQHFLERRKSKSLTSITATYPDIGTTIEKYVEDCNIGADAWRRTGMLTFDGNIKVEKKCTYTRIQEHLQSVYHRHFSYGTVVQLCVARNKRRLSAKRYKGVAQVVSRRARKGFMLKYNPDTHWSNTLYRYLNILQLTDGSDILFVNRDDASGFRLDTLTTHHQFPNPTVRGKEILTTYTDYVNRYPSVLQVTSYNFTATKTTDERCAGVVKAQPLFLKSPAQHAADFDMVLKQPELSSLCSTPQGHQKPIVCIRVDGANDEGPSHEEVQYWWSQRHLLQANVVTLVTTRSSGSSYLNRVELQNGCLSRAHCNLFIPSTLHGLPFSTETGKIDQDILHKNLSTAIDLYIKRCDRASCGSAEIHLYKGANSDQYMHKREKLLVYLKGNKKQKQDLQVSYPEMHSEFDKVWGIRNRHMVHGLPSQYIFFLRCCYEADCPHPVCQKGKPPALPHWYSGGPTIDFFPLPVPDPSRPWGNSNCPDCKGICGGHFLKPNENLQNIRGATNHMLKPPSLVIKEFLQSKDNVYETADIDELARSVLLPAEEVKFWIDHLDTVKENRKRGAQKARLTRQAKKQY